MRIPRRRLEKLLELYPHAIWAGLACTRGLGWRVFVDEVNGVSSGRRLVGTGRTPRAALRSAERTWTMAPNG